jgi:hypothetical protein
MRGPTIYAGLAIVVGVVLVATVSRDDIARATSLAQTVTVDNTPAQAVPVVQQGPVSVQGTLGARPVAPQAPWRSDISSVAIATGSQKVLAGPSATAINLTSLSAAASPGHIGYLNVLAASVPSSATTCAGADVYEISYALDAVSDPVAITFPTPFQVQPRSGEKLCLLGTAGGTGGNVTGLMSIMASGYYG